MRRVETTDSLLLFMASLSAAEIFSRTMANILPRLIAPNIERHNQPRHHPFCAKGGTTEFHGLSRSERADNLA
jgi:hypothetical protein